MKKTESLSVRCPCSLHIGMGHCFKRGCTLQTFRLGAVVRTVEPVSGAPGTVLSGLSGELLLAPVSVPARIWAAGSSMKTTQGGRRGAGAVVVGSSVQVRQGS